MNDAEMIQNQVTSLDSALKTYQPGNLRHHFVSCKLRKVHLPTIRHKLSGQYCDAREGEESSFTTIRIVEMYGYLGNIHYVRP